MAWYVIVYVPPLFMSLSSGTYVLYVQCEIYIECMYIRFVDESFFSFIQSHSVLSCPVLSYPVHFSPFSSQSYSILNTP